MNPAEFCEKCHGPCRAGEPRVLAEAPGYPEHLAHLCAQQLLSASFYAGSMEDDGWVPSQQDAATISLAERKLRGVE